MVPHDIHPPGSGYFLGALVVSDFLVPGPDVENGVLPVKGGREYGDASLLKRPDFIEPGTVECNIFCGTGHGENTTVTADDVYRIMRCKP